MGFADDINAFTAKVQARTQDVFVRAAEIARDSIVDGSPITGAPGQPVDEGTLKQSWTLEFESPTSALIASGGPAEAYNWQIEEGEREGRALMLRSKVGGFHSVKATVAGMNRIVAAATAEVIGNG
jgi:hypothetical protein